MEVTLKSNKDNFYIIIGMPFEVVERSWERNEESGAWVRKNNIISVRMDKKNTLYEGYVKNEEVISLPFHVGGIKLLCQANTDGFPSVSFTFRANSFEDQILELNFGEEL
jgi:hypothetical protein